MEGVSQAAALHIKFSRPLQLCTRSLASGDVHQHLRDLLWELAMVFALQFATYNALLFTNMKDSIVCCLTLVAGRPIS